MPDSLDDLAGLWSELLSAEAARIRRAWRDLTDEECQSVIAHLERMRAEPGWQPEQQQAAAEALRVLREQAE